MADFVYKKEYKPHTSVLFGSDKDYNYLEKPYWWKGTQYAWEVHHLKESHNERNRFDKHEEELKANRERNGDLDASFFLNVLGKDSHDNEREKYKRSLNTKAKWKAEREREKKLLKEMKHPSKTPKNFQQKELELQEPYYGFFEVPSDGELSYGEKMIQKFRDAAEPLHHSQQGHYPRGGRKSIKRRRTRVSRRKHKKTTRRR
jgi:hypothetical protein